MRKVIVLTARVIDAPDNRAVDFGETDVFDQFIEDVHVIVRRLMDQHDTKTCCVLIEKP